VPLQVTVTWPVPGRVAVPIAHDQLARPAASAEVLTSPWAALGAPSGVTYQMAQFAPGAVCTVTLALPPGGPPTTETNKTAEGAGLDVGWTRAAGGTGVDGTCSAGAAGGAGVTVTGGGVGVRDADSQPAKSNTRQPPTISSNRLEPLSFARPLTAVAFSLPSGPFVR
jgi:hypothetical protein